MPQTINNMSVTWTNSLTTYTGIKLNAAGSSDANSAAGSLLMDLQVGGNSGFQVTKNGLTRIWQIGTSALPFMEIGGANQVRLRDVGVLAWTNGGAGGTSDVFLARRAAANLRLGAADAAVPVAQTLSVQSGTAGASALSCSISGTTLTVGGAVTGTIAIGHAVTGTGVSAGTVITAGSGTTWTVNNSQTVSSTTMYFNSVGQNLTITGSQGSGPSAGGSIVFQVAPAGTAGTTAQNALATALTIAPSSSGNAGLPSVSIGGATNVWLQAIDANTLGVAGMAALRGGGTEGIWLKTGLGIGSAVNSPDVYLYRDAPGNILALRNGGTSGTPVPQTFRVYNWTDGTNSEFGKIAWSSNVLQIGTEKAGMGQLRGLSLAANEISFLVQGVYQVWLMSTGGHLLAGTDNSYDIGGSSGQRPRNIYAGTSIGFGSFGAGVWNSSGVFLGTNQTLCFGGASTDLYLHREGTGILAIRKSTDPQTFRLYNTWTSFGTGTEIWERGKFAWESNVLTIGTEKGANGGTARALEFQTDGVTRWTINNGQSAFWGANTGTVETTLRLTNTSGNFWFGIDTSSGGTFHSGTAYSRVLFASGNYPIAISTNSTRRLIISGDGLVQFAGTDNTFPALKRSSTTLQARLADDSAFASVQGKLTTDTAYTAGAPTPTGYIVLYDSTGTAYRVPAVLN